MHLMKKKEKNTNVDIIDNIKYIYIKNIISKLVKKTVKNYLFNFATVFLLKNILLIIINNPTIINKIEIIQGTKQFE